MATLFEARQRFALRHDAAATAAVVATISRSIRRTSTALTGTPRVDTPRALAEDPGSRTSALWILHAR
jgi:hypothetical protein